MDDSKIIDNDSFFDTSIYKIDLNNEMKSFYDVIGNYEAFDTLDNHEKLNKLRNNNHIKYYKINISRIFKLPSEFNELIKNIEQNYNSINPSQLLTETLEAAQHSSKLINIIQKDLDTLDRIVKLKLKDISESNDNYQDLFSVDYFNSLDIEESLKKQLLNIYSKLINTSIEFSYDDYENYKLQDIRKKYITKILNLLNDDEKEKLINFKKQQLELINNKIEIELTNYQDYLKYLNKIIINNSKYKKDLNEYQTTIDSIKGYNNKNKIEIDNIYNKLTKFKVNFDKLKGKILDELEIKKSLPLKPTDFNNYIDLLIKKCNYKIDEENTNILNYILDSLSTKKYNIKDLEMALGLVIRNIWQSTITNIKDYKENEDFYFICSNNQFIDEKYETILLTRKEILNTDKYFDYQIGFICGYNDNIMYITERQDVMEVQHKEIINFKTPYDVEDEFVNFDASNRISLNGYNTKLEAVYLIDDGNPEKQNKAKELSEIYELPLIVIKK